MVLTKIPFSGVQSLVVAENALGADAELFSGSRDTGIKKWDIRHGELKQVLTHSARGPQSETNHDIDFFEFSR